MRSPFMFYSLTKGVGSGGWVGGRDGWMDGWRACAARFADPQSQS